LGSKKKKKEGKVKEEEKGGGKKKKRVGNTYCFCGSGFEIVHAPPPPSKGRAPTLVETSQAHSTTH
jgi:hypothetical protein